MMIHFQPKNIGERFAWFATIPFYAWQDLLNGGSLDLEEKEISSIIKGKRHLVTYHKDGFTGTFHCLNMPSEAAGKFPMGEADSMASLRGALWQNMKEHVKHLHLRSPAFMTAVILIVETGVALRLRSFLRQALVGHLMNSRCNLACARSIFDIDYIFAFVVAAALLPLVIGAIYFTLLAKRCRNANAYMGVRCESLLVAVVSVFVLLGSAGQFFKTGKKLISTHQRLYLQPTSR